MSVPTSAFIHQLLSMFTIPSSANVRMILAVVSETPEMCRKI